MELGEVVGAHQPDEAHAGSATLQGRDRIGGVVRSQVRLDAGHENAGMGRELAASGDAAAPAAAARRCSSADCPASPATRRRRASVGLTPSGDDEQMRLMRRIERAAEQADALAGRDGAEVLAASSCGEQCGSVQRSASRRARNQLRPHLPAAAHAIFEGGQLLDADRARAHACGRSQCRSRAPKPNSPPSANCVEALCSTIALNRPRRGSARPPPRRR